jgi:hypothetical protein
MTIFLDLGPEKYELRHAKLIARKMKKSEFEKAICNLQLKYRKQPLRLYFDEHWAECYSNRAKARKMRHHFGLSPGDKPEQIAFNQWIEKLANSKRKTLQRG